MPLLVYPGRLIGGAPGLDPAAARRGRRGLAMLGLALAVGAGRRGRGCLIWPGLASVPGRLALRLRGRVAPAAARHFPAGLVLPGARRVPVRPWSGAVAHADLVRVAPLRLSDVGPARAVLALYVTPDAVPYLARPVGITAARMGRWRGPRVRVRAGFAPVLYLPQWTDPGGLSDGLALPAAWLAYPLPAGEWIGYALAALALARGESWQWDGEGGARVAGRRLMRREGWQRAFMNEATAARWRAQYTAELAGVLAGRLCSPGDDLAVWQEHGRERDRGAARRLLALAKKQQDPGKRDALRADAAWLIARI